MDAVAAKIAGLGVPGLILLVAIRATRLRGAAAITVALASLGGPLGMIGGIGVLAATALMSDTLAQYGFGKILKTTITKMMDKGIGKEEIIRKVEVYPITRKQKDQVLYQVHKTLGSI